MSCRRSCLNYALIIKLNLHTHLTQFPTLSKYPSKLDYSNLLKNYFSVKLLIKIIKLNSLKQIVTTASAGTLTLRRGVHLVFFPFNLVLVARYKPSA